MADQGKWFKLWESALDDQQLEDLDLDNWARWARLGTYMKKHGKEGRLIITAPCRSLQTLLRVSNFEAVLRVVKSLPGYVFEEMKSVTDMVTRNVTDVTVTFMITSTNWNKYQGDYSAERVRRYRQRKQGAASPDKPKDVTANGTANVTRQEEKRREETKSPLSYSSLPQKSRSAPPDAPAPRSVVMAGDERREATHEDFIASGHVSSEQPSESFGWERLEYSLSKVERVQSKWREKTYAERKPVSAVPQSKAVDVAAPREEPPVETFASVSDEDQF